MLIDSRYHILISMANVQTSYILYFPQFSFLLLGNFSTTYTWWTYSYSICILLFRSKFLSNSFFTITFISWNKLPKWRFPDHYDIKHLISKVNCYLSSIYALFRSSRYTLVTPSFSNHLPWMTMGLVLIEHQHKDYLIRGRNCRG